MRGIGRGGGEGDETFLRGFWSLKFDLDTSNFQFLSNKMDYKEEDTEIGVYSLPGGQSDEATPCLPMSSRELTSLLRFIFAFSEICTLSNFQL